MYRTILATILALLLSAAAAYSQELVVLDERFQGVWHLEASQVIGEDDELAWGRTPNFARARPTSLLLASGDVLEFERIVESENAHGDMGNLIQLNTGRLLYVVPIKGEPDMHFAYFYNTEGETLMIWVLSR